MDFIQQDISFFIVATTVLPFVVQAIKKLDFMSHIDPRNIAMGVALVAGVLYAAVTTFVPKEFLVHVAAFAALTWSAATALYRQYRNKQEK